MEFVPSLYHQRRIAKLEESSFTGEKAGLLLFALSVYWYKKRFFVKDKNLFNWLMFSGGSLFASTGISGFLFESTYAAAARINN